MDASAAVDGLPPEARFALRAVAAGAPVDEAARLLRLDGTTVRKHLRTAARATGASPPPPSAGDDALMAALAPALAAAREPPARAPATACLAPDVARAMAGGELDGPLLLAEAEHAADCPACLGRVLAMRGGAAPATVGPSARRRSIAPWLIAAAAATAAAAVYLLAR